MDLGDIGKIALIVSAVVALFSYLIGNKIVRRQTLMDLLKEYRSLEMGLAVQRMWDFYRNTCDKDKESLIEEYKKEYKKSEKKLEEPKLNIEQMRNSLHYQRRIVSNFYGHLAILFSNKALDENLVFEIWPKDTLKIIPKILVPIETKALPELFGKKERFSETIKYMLDLYKKSETYVPKRKRETFLLKLRKLRKRFRTIIVQPNKWDKFKEICHKKDISLIEEVRKLIREFSAKEKDK